MRYLELFAGAGGLSLGLDAAGLTCVAHAEIEPHARAVLRRHWPDTPLRDDVRQVQGADWPCELVSGGSPCQDLSVAGKRAGLGGARSGLFFEQIRVWEESRAPYLLWENVAGALSSNAGADFAAVLSAIVGGTVPVPSDGWRGAGVVSGPAGVAAWRLLDLQWFGPPQRRRRVFVLGARAGGVDPAAVLLEPESVCRHPAPRRDAREGSAGSVGRGAQESRGVTEFLPQSSRVYMADGLAPALQATGTRDGNRAPQILAYDTTQVTSVANRSNPRAGDPCHPLAAMAHAPLVVDASIAFHANMNQNGPVDVGVSPTSTKNGSLAVLAFAPLQGGRSMPVTPECPTLEAGTGNKAPAVIAFDWQNSPSQGMACRSESDDSLRTSAAPAVLAFDQHNQIDTGDTTPTVRTNGQNSGAPVVFAFQRSDSYADAPSVASTLGASEHKQQKDIIVEAGHGTAPVSTEARGTEGVRALHGAAHAEAIQRTVGRSGCLCTTEVLQSDVHGGCVRYAPVEGDGTADGAVSREQGAAGGTVRAVREAERDGRAPQGPEPVQQRSGEPRTDLPELPPSGALAGAPYGVGVPRRLMPIEAERLMSWPDRHTETGLREDGTPYRLSDAARYKLCGNGVGSKCTEWIGRRLMDAHARLRTAA